MVKYDVGLLLLRIFVGALMLIGHGWNKLQNFSVIAPQFPDPLGLGGDISLALAVFSEVFCSAAIMLGLFTRVAAIPLFATMAVAALIVHGADPFAKKELAVLYGSVYLTLIISGGGRLGIEEMFRKR